MSRRVVQLAPSVCLMVLLYSTIANGMDYTFTQINIPGATLSDAYGINNHGQVVGSYATGNPSEGQIGFILNNDGTVTSFSVPGSGNTYAFGINSSGQVVGYSEGAQYPFPRSAFLREPDGVITPLNLSVPNSSITESTAYRINDMQQITGYLRTSADPNGPQGFLSANGGTTILNAPGATAGTVGVGINNAGQVVGAAGTRLGDGNIVNQAFIREPNGSYTLFSGPGAFNTGASGINNLGQIVGTYTPALSGAPPSIQYVRDTNGNFTTVNGPGVSKLLLNDINDRGQIVGTLFDQTGQHGFIASPVPLPTSLLLFASGLVGISGLNAWRRGAFGKTAVCQKPTKIT